MAETETQQRTEPQATLAGFVVRPSVAKPSPRRIHPPVFTETAPNTPALRALILSSALAQLEDDDRRRR